MKDPQLPKKIQSAESPVKALIASVSGYAMDGFDLLILGFMLPAISLSLQLNISQAGSLVTWTLLGAVAGGLFFGQLSDRFGRIRVLSLCILTFSIFTGLCAVAQGYWDLLIYRTLAGFGLGGEFGIGMALIAETWPASKRNRASSYVALGWQAGVLAAALITPVLLPHIGWRGMFLVGLAPALVSLVIRHAMGEPEEFIRSAKEPLSFARRFGELIKDRHTLKASIGVTVLTSVQNFGYYGLMIWMPSYLSERFGFSLMQSGTWTAVTVAGMAIGNWHLDLWSTSRQIWPVANLSCVPSRRGSHGSLLCPPRGSLEHAAHRSSHGCVCEWNDRWLRSFDF